MILIEGPPPSNVSALRELEANVPPPNYASNKDGALANNGVSGVSIDTVVHGVIEFLNNTVPHSIANNIPEGGK